MACGSWTGFLEKGNALREETAGRDEKLDQGWACIVLWRLPVLPLALFISRSSARSGVCVREVNDCLP